MLRRCLAVAMFAVVCYLSGQSELGEALKVLGSHYAVETGGTDAGLKQALELATEDAVLWTGAPNGFTKNEEIRILVPDQLRPVEKALRRNGRKHVIDEFVLSMNRAAEKASPAAEPILKCALTDMTFDDARRILKGRNTAATEYFKSHASDRLEVAFRPAVDDAMHEAGVEQKYQAVVGNAPKNFDLHKYVATKTLDGIFYMIAQDERRIRTDRGAQITPLLREVFGHQSK